MGRDDAKAIPGLQGGTAPARAFASFMSAAVANRPVEQFETNVPMPDWQLEPDEEGWDAPYQYEGNAQVDENGMSVTPPSDPLAPVPQPGQQGAPDQTELDRIFNSPLPPRELRAPPPPQQQEPPSNAADPLQPRPDSSQQ